jgi:hypothetical protein
MSVEAGRGASAETRPGEVTYDHLIIPPHWRRSEESAPRDQNPLFPADAPAGVGSPSPVNPATGPLTNPMTGPLLVGTTARAFAKLDDMVRLSAADRAVVDARRDEAERALRAIFPPRCTLPLVGVATIGSAGRDTMIRPLDEVDIFVVFSAANSAWKRFRWDSRDLLLCVRNAIGGERVQTIGSRGQALRVVYESPPDVHLVPAFDHPRAGYVIPDRIGGWVPTRPERHASWMVDAGPRVVSAVRLLKVWNRVCGSHLRSFHLEALAGKALRERGLNTRQGLAEVFRHMDEAGFAVSDPADVGGDLASYLQPEDHAALGEAVRLARTYSAKAVDAEQEGAHEEAVALWGTIFGPEFPTFG